MRELLELWQRRHSRPCFLCGRAQELEDTLQLVIHVAAGKQGPASVSQLGEDAAGTPHVNAGSVELSAEEHIRRAIPQSDHLSIILLN